jgi:hypothetical protein
MASPPQDVMGVPRHALSRVGTDSRLHFGPDHGGLGDIMSRLCCLEERGYNPFRGMSPEELRANDRRSAGRSCIQCVKCDFSRTDVCRVFTIRFRLHFDRLYLYLGLGTVGMYVTFDHFALLCKAADMPRI